jgi:hypothetical protein
MKLLVFFAVLTLAACGRLLHVRADALPAQVTVFLI